MWKRVLIFITLFCVGAVGYGGLEILWRGHTHWTMLLCGGICLMLLVQIEHRMSQKDIWRKSAAGCGMITAVEFGVGCIVNKGLGMQVWDYSDVPGNLFGQICLPFMLIWFVICVLLFGVFSIIRQLRIKYRRTGYSNSTTI